ncbi:MAG TPA: glutathione S-transferase N-terminal domain-containing protein [Caulobacter sp.]|nr:glutathione S-transferase N-terminal domain-containing protein [Caulobacter sp.]
MTLRLHHSPMACSLASRFALAESGLDHEIVVVRTRTGEHLTEAYGRINPRRKVPALETGGGVVTESSAILPLIADLAPDAGLLPSDPIARAQAQSWIGFLASTVHPAFTRSMFPERFTTDADGAEGVRGGALEALASALSSIDAHLAGREHLLDAFSVCDLYLTVFLLWRRGPALAGRLPDLPNLDAFQQRVLARPAVAAALGEDMKAMAGG